MLSPLVQKQTYSLQPMRLQSNGHHPWENLVAWDQLGIEVHVERFWLAMLNHCKRFYFGRINRRNSRGVGHGHAAGAGHGPPSARSLSSRPPVGPSLRLAHLTKEKQEGRSEE